MSLGSPVLPLVKSDNSSALSSKSGRSSQGGRRLKSEKRHSGVMIDQLQLSSIAAASSPSMVFFAVSPAALRRSSVPGSASPGRMTCTPAAQHPKSAGSSSAASSA